MLPTIDVHFPNSHIMVHMTFLRILLTNCTGKTGKTINLQRKSFCLFGLIEWHVNQFGVNLSPKVRKSQNRVDCTFIFIFLFSCFSRAFFFFGTWSNRIQTICKIYLTQRWDPNRYYQNCPGNNGNEGVLPTPQISKAGNSLSDRV